MHGVVESPIDNRQLLVLRIIHLTLQSKNYFTNVPNYSYVYLNGGIDSNHQDQFLPIHTRCEQESAHWISLTRVEPLVAIIQPIFSGIGKFQLSGFRLVNSFSSHHNSFPFKSCIRPDLKDTNLGLTIVSCQATLCCVRSQALH